MLRSTLAAPSRTRAAVAAFVATLALAAAVPAVAATPSAAGDAAAGSDGPVRVGVGGLGGPCKGDESADFRGKGDRPHIAHSRKLPYISVHGYWVKCRPDARGSLAKVTVELQQYRGGGWVTVATGVDTVRPGGGAGNRATAQGRCHTYRGRSYHYRARVDVDIIGYADTKEKAYGRVGRSNCSVLGR